MRKCINCGGEMDNHPRRIYCDKHECQNKRRNEKAKRYQKKKRAEAKGL